ncbi:uncharacterized protein CPUR_05881 [Claviceps purpurea 20.1]|uniref:FAR1 domain-containing protein n=1 Tax=Claviceps purpurea (strain 20.1) TaxID=1111077 RepID=M1WD88_CLAP2|nr:uncharacterized protein CPUR_05881 [Claviceps purpurea 20.1]
MTRYERPISAIEKEYTDVEEAHSAIQEHQRLEGFVCVKAGNSRNRLTGVVSYRVLQCRQSRCYRESPGKKHKYSTTSYKTNCPFRARILFNKHKNTHSLKVMEPSHNHDPIESPISSSTLRLRTQRQFGTERLLSIIDKKSKGNELTASQIAEEIHAEHPEILIVGLDVFFLQKKLRLRASRGEPLIQGAVSDEEAPAADHGEPGPDDMRPQQQISGDTAPPLDNAASSDEIPSDDDGNGGYAPGSPVGQTSETHRTRVPSSGRKGGNRQGSVSARLDQLQSTVSKLLESVEALREAHYATQAALAAQAAQHPPWQQQQHHANPASQHQNFPVASWPTHQSETAQSNAQPPQTGGVSQFIDSHCAGPNFLASQSNEHMASGYTAGLHYPAAQRRPR